MNIKNYKGLMAALLGVSLFGLTSTALAKEESAAVIAVFDIQDTRARNQRLPLESLKAMRDYLANQLAQDGLFKVVPSSDIQAALRQAQAESYKDCYDEACQIEIGKEIAAQKSLSTKITQFDTECVVSATLYDLRASASDKAASAKSACSQPALLEALERVALKLKGPSAQALQVKPWNWTPTYVALAGVATSIVAVVIGVAANASYESGSVGSEVKPAAQVADTLLWTGAAVAAGGVTWQVLDF